MKKFIALFIFCLFLTGCSGVVGEKAYRLDQSYFEEWGTCSFCSDEAPVDYLYMDYYGDKLCPNCVYRYTTKCVWCEEAFRTSESYTGYICPTCEEGVVGSCDYCSVPTEYQLQTENGDKFICTLCALEMLGVPEVWDAYIDYYESN